MWLIQAFGTFLVPVNYHRKFADSKPYLVKYLVGLPLRSILFVMPRSRLRSFKVIHGHTICLLYVPNDVLTRLADRTNADIPSLMELAGLGGI